MRFSRMILSAAGIALLSACGGADTETAAATTDTAAVAAATPAAPAGAVASPAAVTGTTHTVRMVGDDKGYRFEPANITVKAGDAIKWVMVSGGPHNVAFDLATVPAAAKAQLSANMPNQLSELSSPMFMNPNEEYTVSFANIPAGTYNYNCTPHLAMNMKGVVTVQ